MAIHDKEVAAILGIHATTLILNWVKRGAIDAQKMEDFAQLLHLEVGGEHRRRRGLMLTWKWKNMVIIYREIQKTIKRLPKKAPQDRNTDSNMVVLQVNNRRTILHEV